MLPSLEVVATRLPGFSKNLLAAVKAIDAMISSFQTKIKSVERDLYREYQALENNLEVRTKKLDRLETMVRNSIASGSLAPQDVQKKLTRLEEACRQLKVENATLRTASDVRARAAYTSTSTSSTNAAEALVPSSHGSPSPSIPRGPNDRDRSREKPRSSVSRASTSMGLGLAMGDDATNDNRWLFRLRDMESKLKMEREARNQDRQAARQRLGGLELENRDLREKMRRAAGDVD